MQRRKFFKILAFPAMATMGLRLTACGRNLGSQAKDGEANPETGKFVDMQDIMAFGLFQAFVPGLANQTIETNGEGTETGTVKTDIILANKPMTYAFWHGHSANPHKFTVTPAHFADLKKGKIVYVATTIDDGHYHVAKLDPKRVDTKSPVVKIPVDVEIIHS